MERYSDRAIEIINELHTERLDYESEYLPLIECANQCKAYEDTGLKPEEVNGLCEMDRRAKMADLSRLEEYQALGPVEELSALVKARDEGRGKMAVKCTKVPPRCPRYRGGNCTAYTQCKYQGSFTNADRIRAMSDEELAAWICLPDGKAEQYETCITILTEKVFNVPYDKQFDPLHDVLYWLQQPAQECHTTGVQGCKHRVPYPDEAALSGKEGITCE